MKVFYSWREAITAAKMNLEKMGKEIEYLHFLEPSIYKKVTLRFMKRTLDKKSPFLVSSTSKITAELVYLEIVKQGLYYAVSFE